MECNATSAYTEKLKAEIQKTTAEEDKLNVSIQALEAELDAGMLQIGSKEFFDKNRELAQKKAQLGYLQDFNNQEQGLKSQLWKMDLYQKILKTTQDLGQEKGLYLVLATEEPKLLPQEADKFSTIVMTHKVLYSGGCVDLTDEVIKKLNQETPSGN